MSSVDPEEDLPTGQEILQDLQPQPLAVGKHCVSLFKNLTAAMGYPSSAYTNLVALAKSCDRGTLRTILKASLRPLVQINIPPKFLNPILEEKPVREDKAYQEKLEQVLLPQQRNTALKKEARNNETSLLAALVYTKLRECYLNEGTLKLKQWKSFMLNLRH